MGHSELGTRDCSLRRDRIKDRSVHKRENREINQLEVSMLQKSPVG